MLLVRLLFIKLQQFCVKKQSILLVYRNKSNEECTLIVEAGFHVVTHEDGRWMGYIHIVFEINILSKMLFSR